MGEKSIYALKPSGEIVQPKMDRELSPEVIEKIMERVRSINTLGIGYTAINNPADLSGFLNNGILGQTRAVDAKESPATIDYTVWQQEHSESESEHNRAAKQKAVYFNIVGRGQLNDIVIDETQAETQAEQRKDEWLRKKGYETPVRRCRIPEIVINDWSVRSSNEVILMFSIQGFKETQPDNRDGQRAPQNTFRANSIGTAGDYYLGIDPSTEEEAAVIEEASKLPPEKRNEMIKMKLRVYSVKDGIPMDVNTEYGFRLTPRVPPETLTGIILKPRSFYKYEDALRDGFLSPELDAYIEKQTQDAVEQMKKVYNGREKEMLPIYDFLGNLRWPKKLDFEIVDNLNKTEDKIKTEP